MKNYVILADSACDIKKELLNDWGVKISELSFMFGDDPKVYLNSEITAKEFYDEMRGGRTAKTSAINTYTFVEFFENELKNGNDVVYIGFSSGLSTTYNSAVAAAEELNARYTDNKVYTVDSLSASAGYGLLVFLATKQKEKGMSAEEIVAFVEKNRLKIAHWFTVDDLVYLKRGGRISPTLAFVGGVLGIKPVLHMDNAGHLVNVTKVRGRRAAIMALAEKLKTADLSGANTIYISHGDCIEDAQTLAKIIKTEYKRKVEIITDVGSVIGAHSGPGTLALFFVANER